VESETGRYGKERCKEHAEDLKKKKESPVLWRHCKEKHDGERQEFVYKVKQMFGNDATLRQVTEAIDIKRDENAINNKTERNQTSLPRLGVLEKKDIRRTRLNAERVIAESGELVVC